MHAIEQLINEEFFCPYGPELFMPPVHTLRMVKDIGKGKEPVDAGALRLHLKMLLMSIKPGLKSLVRKIHLFMRFAFAHSRL